MLEENSHRYKKPTENQKLTMFKKIADTNVPKEHASHVFSKD